MHSSHRVEAKGSMVWAGLRSIWSRVRYSRLARDIYSVHLKNYQMLTCAHFDQFCTEKPILETREDHDMISRMWPLDKSSHRDSK